MERAQLEAFAAALAAKAERRPGWYRTKVVLLGGLGYVYILGVLALALAVPVATVWMVVTGAGEAGAQLLLRIGLPAVLIAYAIIRALHVSFPTPDGLPLPLDQAPRLVAAISELREAIGAPRFHRVLLTNEFNAAVAEVPRLGVFGWPRYYLLLGLPLMAGLSAAQFRAVLAHELGHHSRRHGRIASWVYRIRVTWLQVVDQLTKARRGRWLFNRFFNWYGPYFSAYSFVLARAQEYEADRHAASLTSPRDLGDALVVLDVKGRYLEAVLRPAVDRQVESREEPPDHVQRDFARQLAVAPPAALAGRYLTAALGQDTGGVDTHPALRDRLAAIGYEVGSDPAAAFARAASAGHGSAATELLGADLADRLADRLDEAWRAAVRGPWRSAHDRLLGDRERLAAIVREADVRELSNEESRIRAQLTEALDGGSAAIPLYAAIVEANPGDAASRFALGRLLCLDGRAEAADHLERLSGDVRYGPATNRLLARHHLDRGDPDAARRCMAAATVQADLLDHAEQERSTWLKSQQLVDPDLPAPELEAIRRVLVAEPTVKTAYLVRKQVEYAPEYPQHLLIVLANHGFTARSEAKMNRELARKLAQAIHVDGDLRIRVYASRKDWLVSRARKVRQGRFYSKRK